MHGQVLRPYQNKALSSCRGKQSRTALGPWKDLDLQGTSD